MAFTAPSHQMRATPRVGKMEMQAALRPQVRAAGAEKGEDSAVEQKDCREDPHPILPAQAEQRAVLEKPMQHGADLSLRNDELAF
jgi:hypothetical protein